ncbi:MAG: pyridoxal-phosphate dependent enzyme [Lachnospiraceae bacterium]|nr:pyridoxal-phosphate dependent enzyme [Lachnospiraceae bacterium]
MRQIALFERGIDPTPIVEMSGDYGQNRYFIKREDMIPFSFGGNKARKAAEFYKEIKACGADVVMTYGSHSSNHCRIIANMTRAMGLDCHIISPEENREMLYNTKLVEDFGAVVETCPVTQVSETIDRRVEAYKQAGRNPYFILGGGHGNPGTHACANTYREIAVYEERFGIHFDYIFHASGTGATQAGLVSGKLLVEARRGENDQPVKEQKIIGISIARNEERGREVVRQSIEDYLGEQYESLYREEELIFTDAYCMGGYGKYTQDVRKTIEEVMNKDGIPMDSTYVGKAFYGMKCYVEEHQIVGRNILFLHTGGTPLFFDLMDKMGSR